MKNSNPVKKENGDKKSSNPKKGLIRGLLIAIALFQIFPFMPAKATPSQKEKLRMGLMKDSCFYSPNATCVLTVAFDNRYGKTLKEVTLRIRVQRAVSSRDAFDVAMDPKTRKTYRFSKNLESNLTIKPGQSSFKFEFPLEERFKTGVFPFTVEAVKSDEILASALSSFVVASQEDMQTFKRLKFSLVFDILEPAHKRLDGTFIDLKLASECESSEKNPGWLATLTDELTRHNNIRATIALSPLLADEMEDASDGFEYHRNGKVEKVSKSSKEAKEVEKVLNKFREMAQVERFQFLSTPYSSPDLENLVSLGWTEDAKKQISKGHAKLESCLETPLGKEFYYPPGLFLNSYAAKKLSGSIGNFLLLSPELLERSKEGRKLLYGLTLSSPVRIKAGSKNDSLALFADARIQKLIKRMCTSQDAHGVAQCLTSELMLLFQEQPSRLRAIVLVWPGWWRPGADVFNEVIQSLESAPFLENVTLAESLMSVPPLNTEPVEIPAPEDRKTTMPYEYEKALTLAHERLINFANAVDSDNPLIPLLTASLYNAESDVWRQWERQEDGLSCAYAVTQKVDDELGKVEIPQVGSINLTSTKAQIPLSIVNGTGYRLKLDLELKSNGLSFPYNKKKITLEPKENLIEIPVKVKKKGSVRLNVKLKADGITVSEVQITVLTSRFNIFAIAFVATLLGIISLIWIIRIYRRLSAGKHKKRRKNQEKAEAETGS